MTTYGLVPAAGKSRRMGRPKLLLPVGQSTVLELVLAAVRSAGVRDVLVVVAPGDDSLAQCAVAAGAHIFRLPEDTPDMRATCLCGLAWLEEHFHPKGDDGWLLLPADHPTIRPNVVRALLAATEEKHDKTIFVPTFAGRRGHPTLLRWSHVADVRSSPAKHGLNTFIRSRSAVTCELVWPSDVILRDLDTPEDYERLVNG